MHNLLGVLTLDKQELLTSMYSQGRTFRDEFKIRSTLKSVDLPSTPFIQTRTVLSLEHEAKRCPEGEKATPMTASEWPQNL